MPKLVIAYRVFEKLVDSDVESFGPKTQRLWVSAIDYLADAFGEDEDFDEDEEIDDLGVL